MLPRGFERHKESHCSTAELTLAFFLPQRELMHLLSTFDYLPSLLFLSLSLSLSSVSDPSHTLLLPLLFTIYTPFILTLALAHCKQEENQTDLS